MQRNVAVECAADARCEEDSEWPVSNRFSTDIVGAVSAGTQVEVFIPDQHLRHHRVGELQPATGIEKEIVLRHWVINT